MRPNVENPADIPLADLIEICATVVDGIPQNLAAVIYYRRADDVKEIHTRCIWDTNDDGVIYNRAFAYPCSSGRIVYTRDELFAYNTIMPGRAARSCSVQRHHNMTVTRLRESILKTPFYFPGGHTFDRASERSVP